MEVLVLSTANGSCLGVLKMTAAETAIYDPVTRQKKYIVVGAVYDEELIVPQLNTEKRMAVIPKGGAVLFDTNERQIYFGDGITVGGFRSALNVNDLPDMSQYALACHDHDYNWQYAPLSHAKDESIHVTAEERTFWNYTFHTPYDPEKNKAATMADINTAIENVTAMIGEVETAMIALAEGI